MYTLPRNSLRNQHDMVLKADYQSIPLSSYYWGWERCALFEGIVG